MGIDKQPVEKKLKVTGIILVIASLLLLWIIISVVSSSDKDGTADNNTQMDTSTNLSAEVNDAINKLGSDMKKELASTSQNGHQGDIVSVEPAVSADGVKVKVSTHFDETGDEPDGGRNIARKIFSNICLEVPQLESLYVVSGSGLESKSVYRDDIPGCK